MNQQAAKIILNGCYVGNANSRPGLVNINTASKAVLSALPHVKPDVASAIVDRQSTGFAGVGDLVETPGVGLPDLSQIVDLFCVSSRAFLVRSMGVAGDTRVSVEACIQLDGKGGAAVVREQPVLFADVFPKWNWPPQASSQVILSGAQ